MACDTENEISCTLFLEAFRCALHSERVVWADAPEGDDWSGMCRLAREHDVLPLLAEALNGTPAAKQGELRWELLKKSARELTIGQAHATAEFGLLYRYLWEHGLRPAVVKGITLRQLYPEPDRRISVDEDLLVSEEEFAPCCRALEEYGLRRVHAEEQEEGACEASFCSGPMHLYIEVSTKLFAPDSAAYGDCNAPLDGALERSIETRIGGCVYRTLSHTDHLIYLLLHAYKHLLHGGFGIRQIADVCVFADRYEDEIDLRRVEDVCCGMKLSRFAAAMLAIGRDKLGLCTPELFCGVETDPGPLLRDVLSGGSFGTASVDRAHSSTMTLEAVASQKRGRRNRGAVSSVFLPRRALEGRYPYLKRRPWLLPVAWAQRVHGYLFGKKKVSPKDSIRIGRERTELLRLYGIIE